MSNIPKDLQIKRLEEKKLTLSNECSYEHHKLRCKDCAICWIYQERLKIKRKLVQLKEVRNFDDDV